MALGWDTDLPLVAAVDWWRHDVVVWLLSHGADPNGYEVMYHSAWNGNAAILQLLIDAGGDVNRKSRGERPLFWAIGGRTGPGNLRLLLSQPSLDLTIKSDGKKHQSNMHVAVAGRQRRT